MALVSCGYCRAEPTAVSSFSGLTMDREVVSARVCTGYGRSFLRMEMGQRPVRVVLHRGSSGQEGVDGPPDGSLLLWLFEHLAKLPDIGPRRSRTPRPAWMILQPACRGARAVRTPPCETGSAKRPEFSDRALRRRLVPTLASLLKGPRGAAQHNAAQAEYDRLAALV